MDEINDCIIFISSNDIIFCNGYWDIPLKPKFEKDVIPLIMDLINRTTDTEKIFVKTYKDGRWGYGP